MKVVYAICDEVMLCNMLSRGVDLIAILPETTQERKVWSHGKSDPDVYHDVIAWRVVYRVARDCAVEDL